MKQILKTLLLVLSISLVSCKKDGKYPPEILKTEVTEITATSAVVSVELVDYWEGLEMGIVWNTDPDRILMEADNFLFASHGKHFFIEITDLAPDTKYYVMAFVGASYAIKKVIGINNYGELVEFTTLAE